MLTPSGVAGSNLLNYTGRTTVTAIHAKFSAEAVTAGG